VHVGRLRLFSCSRDYRNLKSALTSIWGPEEKATLVARIYRLLTKEAAYEPNTQHLDDFRAASQLEELIIRR
jgi:hypothetical protein